MTGSTPHVGVPSFGPSDWPDRIHASGAEPVPLRLPPARPRGGVALAREWIADATEVLCAEEAGPDSLLLEAGTPEGLFGMLIAAARLNLPTVCAVPPGSPLSASLAALGLAPTGAKGAARLVADGVPPPSDLLDNFSFANALRAGTRAGGGPELIVHLSALAREAGMPGFAQMARVLAPETPMGPPEWTVEHGVPALLASLGDDLHDVPTVSGRLKDGLPGAVDGPDAAHRCVILRARASGAEAFCVAPVGVSEVAGVCRVFPSEEEAVRTVRDGGVQDEELLVVAGCGPRGGPGLLRLDALGEALRKADLRTPVMTDGLAPHGPPGVWASLFAPEAAAGGVMRRLRTGDVLRLALDAGRIRTEVGSEELGTREPLDVPARTGPGYAARYARSALPAIEGAGFG